MWKRRTPERPAISPRVSGGIPLVVPTITRAAVRPACACLLLATVLMSPSRSGAQMPVDAGFRDFFHGTASHSMTAEKPESKLWWNDGVWWGSLLDPETNTHRIHRLDLATQSWIDTGTLLDSRANARADVLWDGASQRLYVVSHVFSTNAKATSASSQWGRLFRYAYNSGTKQYTLDSGFPVSVTRGNAEALTIAKDVTQRLWVTFVQDGRVKVNWSLSDDWEWGVPIDLPVGASAATVDSDDVSGVIAFGNGNIGVMWSNQNTDRVYFAVHRDTNPPTVWEPLETVLPDAGCSGSGPCADDHVNLKADQSGRVFAAVKTNLTASSDPLVMLVVRAQSGEWSAHPVGLKRDHHTRPILVLDEQNDRLYVFATSDENGGAIYVKSSPADSIAFTSGLGEPFIKSDADSTINNPTSSKHNVSDSTGVLVLATDKNTRFYLHNYLPLGTAPPPPPPPAAPQPPSGLDATAVSASRVDLAWSDGSDNELTFHIERASDGGFQEIATAGVNAVGHSDTTVVAGTTYTYRVRARNAAGFSAYSNTASATPSGSGGGQIIKELTFEGGSLTGASGADRVVGTMSIESTTPLKGTYSARVPNAASSYLQQEFPGTDDLYVSFYVRLMAVPSADVRLVQISNAGTTVGNVLLKSTGRLRLREVSTSLGADSAPLAVGQLYRVGVRQRKGSGGDAVLEAFVATADAVFGAPFAATSSGTWTAPADRVRVGATTGNAGNVVLDDILLDAGAMPGPSQ